MNGGGKVFSFFRRKPVLEKKISDWLWETFAWTLRNFGSDVFYARTRLITPTTRYFPDKADSAESLVESTFVRVREYAGMENWPCRLQAQESDPNPVVAPAIVLKGAPSGPAGTFSLRGETREAVITYNPNLIKRPESLIATFAHELAHYLGVMAKAEPPGGKEYREHATDLTAVYLGFGIFMANSAFTFEQYSSAGSHGWSSSQLGYLSEDQLAYALAIFCVLKDIASGEVIPYLDNNLRAVYKRAETEVRESARLGALKSINAKMNKSSSSQSLHTGKQ